MVPVLLYLLVKKYVARKWPALRSRLASIYITRNFLLLVGFIILMLLKVVSLKAQERQLQYNVVRNGKVIGWTKLNQTSSDQQVDIRMQSEVKAKFIFQFLATANEQVSYSSGKVVYSSLYRKLNGNITDEKSMKLTGKGYEVYKGRDTEHLEYPLLHYHTLSLYFQEPGKDLKVYSDSFQRILDLERMPDGGYKLKLPDGNSSSYYYQNGVCTRVKINHIFYSAEMVLHQ